jgi:hypothetical protein
MPNRKKQTIRFRIVTYILLGFICCVCEPRLAGNAFLICAQPANHLPDGSKFSIQVESFMENLEPVSISEALNVFAEYYPVVLRELDAKSLYSAPFHDVKSLLDTAVSESVDVLTLFTHPTVHQGKTIVITKKTLSQIDRRYNLHALFLLSGPSSDRDDMVQMDFLVVGQGKLIVRYDKNMQIKHPDYAFVTGQYEYQELFIMDAGIDKKGNPGLFKIRGLSGANEVFRPLKGPLNSSILALSLKPGIGGEKKVLVQYQLLGAGTKVVERIPIEARREEN